jgi:hypothetical protein
MGRVSRSVVLLGVAVLALTGGGAYALASSLSGGSINVCVSHSDGELYKAKTCAKNDTKLSWGKQGPRGATGVAGATGTQGATGPKGPAGTDGTPGTSVTSATEPAGANCANGGSSFTSVSGKTYACNGAKGDKGDTGAQGPGYSNGAGAVNIGPGGDQLGVDSYTSGASTCYFYLLNATGGALSGWEQVNGGAVSDFSLSQFGDINPVGGAPTLYSFRIIADFGTINLNYWVSVTGPNSCRTSYQYIVSS